MGRSIGGGLLLFAAISILPSGAAAADAKCANPEWAPTPLPGFAIRECEDRAWDSMQVSDGERDQALGGHRRSVTYELKDESKNPSAEKARLYYSQAAQKAGAKLVYHNGYDVVLRKAGPHGDVWYLYDHGNGNESSTGSYTLTTLEVAPPPQEVETRAMPGTLAVDGAKCANPPWLVKQFAAYKLTACDSKAWDDQRLPLTAGEHEVSGRRMVAHYELAHGKPVVVPRAAHIEFVAALKKSGAQIVRGEKETGGAVVASQTSAEGRFWYVWEQAGGNDESMSGYRLTTWQEAPLAQEVVVKPVEGALDTAGCKDPAWLVKQFPYFKRTRCTNRDFDAVEFETSGQHAKMAGRVHEAVYQLTDPKRDPVPLAVKRNYVAALEKLGAHLVSNPDDDNMAVLEQKTPQGDLWYLYRHGSGNDESTTSYSLLTLQAGGPPPKTCKLEIYGVNFDFDKATLKPDSEPVLKEVLAIFEAEPKYSGEIGGHTDNVGKHAYNVKLSGERAAAVKAWLVAHGVQAGRLRTAGYGDSRPLVPNTTDENRAKNRRVELKRDHCTGGA